MSVQRRENACLWDLRSHAAASLLFVAALAFTAPAALAEAAKETKAPKPWRAEVSGPFDSKLRLEMFERVRGEFVEWFGNPIDPSTGKPIPKEYRYNFVGNKLQLGLRFKREPLEIFAQFQDSTLGGIPTNGVGIGSVYFLSTPESTQNSAFLRQGWTKLNNLLGIDGLYLTGGRQLYSDGAQGPAGRRSCAGSRTIG